MAIERRFISKAVSDHKIRAFLRKEVSRAGVSQVILQKTPMATRIILHVRRPGIVVGKKGSSIKELCDKLVARFGVDNPQLDVIEVENPALDATLMAEKIGRQIEIRGNIKQIMRMALKEIMEAGAIGAEIRIAGKVVGKGGKARALKIGAGHLKKSGEPMNLVLEGRYTCFLKAGTIGVQVKIAAPGVKFPDTFDYAAIDAKLSAEAPAVTEAGEAVASKEEKDADLEEKIDEKLSSAKAEEKKVEKAKEKAKEKAPAAKKEEKKAKEKAPAARREKEKPAAKKAERQEGPAAAATAEAAEQRKGETAKEKAAEAADKTQEKKPERAAENEAPATPATSSE